MTKFENVSQQNVQALVLEAIKSDLDNHEKVKKALLYSIKLAASEIGRIQPLNNLVKGVSASTREGIRQYVRNMTAVYGTEVLADNGNIRRVSFLNFRAATAEFSHVKGPDAKACRANVDAASYDDLNMIVMGVVKSEAQPGDPDFTTEKFEDQLSRLIRKALLAGVIVDSTADQLNKFVDASKRVDRKAIQSEAEQKLKRAQDALAKAEAQRNALLVVKAEAKDEAKAEAKADEPKQKQAKAA